MASFFVSPPCFCFFFSLPRLLFSPTTENLEQAMSPAKKPPSLRQSYTGHQRESETAGAPEHQVVLGIGDGEEN